MKNNYEGIQERVELIIKSAQSIKNTSKVTNIKRELSIYKLLIEEAIASKKQVVEVPVKEIKIEKNPEILQLENHINILIKYKKLDVTSTNFKEGLGINKLLYRLENTKNIDEFNSSLLMILQILDSINIKFNENDFKITDDVYKYMKAFLKFSETKTFIKDMKNVYDGLYWENKEILEEININLVKNLKNIEKKIEQMMNKTKLNFIKKYNINTLNVEEQLFDLLKREHELKEIDKYVIKTRIQNKTLNIENFIGENKKITKAINTFINPGDYIKMNINQRSLFEDNITKLLFNIEEFCIYKKFDCLIQEVSDIKKIKFKKNEISKTEKKCNLLIKQKKSINQRQESYENEKTRLLKKKCLSLKGEEKRLDKITTINKILKEYKIEIKSIIKEEQIQQEQIIYLNFVDNIQKNIDSNSTLFDILKLFSNNHKQLLNVLKKNKELTLNEREALMLELKKLVSNPNANMIRTSKVNEIKEYENKIIELAKNYNIEINFENTNDINTIIENAKLVYQFKNLKRSKLNLTTMQSIIN